MPWAALFVIKLAGLTVLFAVELKVGHHFMQVAACDRIMVMAGGCIVAVGTHTQLLAQPGWYADTWAAQHVASPAAMTAGAAKW